VWRLFQNRIATKDNLHKRGVLGQDNLHCVGGCGREESVSHFFFECPLFSGVWYAICHWIGISTAFQKESLSQMEQFEGLIDGRRNFDR